MRNFIIILCISLIIVILTGCSILKKNDPILKEYFKTLDNHKYMMHALGGIDNNTYTNSIDALEKNYELGQRLYEVDLSFTTDKKLVLAHSNNGKKLGDDQEYWTKNDWEKRLGQTYDPNHPLASYDEFMSFKIQGKYKASSFNDLIEFMKKHNDIYVMIDIGNRSYLATKKMYEEIVKEAKGNDKVLQHFIAGGHTKEMIKAVKETYKFKLINLYYNSKDKREKGLNTQDKFLEYCVLNGINSFSASSDTILKEKPTKLINSELISYAFTVNDVDTSKKLFKMNIDVVGTDFLN